VREHSASRRTGRRQRTGARGSRVGDDFVAAFEEMAAHMRGESLSRPYSAASRAAAAGSTRAAQNLNSGILPNGSSAGLVNRLAAAST